MPVFTRSLPSSEAALLGRLLRRQALPLAVLAVLSVAAARQLTWQDAGAMENTSSQDPTTLTVPLGREARYVKLEVRKADHVERILLGEKGGKERSLSQMRGQDQGGRSCP